MAFVVQLGSDTDTAARQFEGWIEEVDSGRELRFRSTDELLRFLCECYEMGQHRQRGAADREDNNDA